MKRSKRGTAKNENLEGINSSSTSKLEIIADLLPYVISFTHVILCPFTKVEESFNLQATHDIIYHQYDIAKYDHLEFPGVVPRTFIGAAFISALAWPVNQLASIFYTSFDLQDRFHFSEKLITQIIVRAVLGFLVSFGLVRLRRSISTIFGKSTSILFILLSCITQFHLMFYSSRTLPNTFALALVLQAYTYWLKGDNYKMIFLFSFTLVVFRSEVVVLLAPIILDKWVRREVPFIKSVIVGAISGIVSLLITISVDSMFWTRWLWPEGEVLWFNTYHNKSSEWGVSPYHWYFTSALPKALLGAIPLIFVGLYFEFNRTKRIVGPIIAFLLLYSFLPHKELRFIFYVIPIFNLVAAVGLNRLFNQRNKSLMNKFIFMVAIFLLVLSTMASTFLLYISSQNYPGGYALQRLHSTENEAKAPYVHIDVASAMTGVSRYGEKPGKWRYSKEENRVDFDPFTHLLTENSTVTGFDVIDKIQGYDGINLNWRQWKNLLDIVRLTDKIYIMKRK